MASKAMLLVVMVTFATLAAAKPVTEAHESSVVDSSSPDFAQQETEIDDVIVDAGDLLFPDEDEDDDAEWSSASTSPTSATSISAAGVSTTPSITTTAGKAITTATPKCGKKASPECIQTGNKYAACLNGQYWACNKKCRLTRRSSKRCIIKFF